MVAKLQRAESAERAGKDEGNGAKKGWFWGAGVGTDGKVEGEGRWEREAKLVEAKSREVRRIVREEGALEPGALVSASYA